MNISHDALAQPDVQLEIFVSLRGIKALIQLDGDNVHSLIAKEPDALDMLQSGARQAGLIAHALGNLHGPGLCSISTPDAAFITKSGGNLVVAGGDGMNLGMCSIALQQSSAWQPQREAPRNALEGLIDVIARSVLPRRMSAEVEGVSHEYELHDGCLIDPAGTVMSLLEALRNGRPVHYCLAPQVYPQAQQRECAFISALVEMAGDEPGDSWKVAAQGWPEGADINSKAHILRDVLRIARALKALVKNDDLITVDYLCADRRRVRAASKNARELINVLHGARAFR